MKPNYKENDLLEVKAAYKFNLKQNCANLEDENWTVRRYIFDYLRP